MNQNITYRSLFPAISIDYGQFIPPSFSVEEANNIFKTLPEKGMDRLTEGRIEHIICTSALAAFF